MSAAWILMTFEVALVATLGISWSIYIIIRQARRIYSKFGLSQEDVVRFDDIISNAPRVEQDDDGVVGPHTEEHLGARARDLRRVETGPPRARAAGDPPRTTPAARPRSALNFARTLSLALPSVWYRRSSFMPWGAHSRVQPAHRQRTHTYNTRY